MPRRQKPPPDVQSSPLRTMKKCVELQVATKPRSSSIRASSAPACVAWMQARMSLILEWELSFGSWSAGPVRRTWTVNERDAAREHLGPRLLPFGDDDDRGGADRRAAGPGRASASCRASPSGGCGRRPSMPLASRQSNRRATSASRSRPMSIISIGRRRRAGRDGRRGRRSRPSISRSPSHTPSPSTKPESNTDTMARSRCTSAPSTDTSTSSLRGSPT